MKKIIILTLLVIISHSVKSQCCRSIDIKVKIIEPSTKTIVYSPGKLFYKVRIYNQGIDTIRSIDTFTYKTTRRHNLNLDVIESFKWRFPRAVAYADSIDVIGNLNLDDTLTDINLILEIHGYLQNRKTNDIMFEMPPHTQDNYSDVQFKMYYDPKHATVKSIFKNQLLTYPNPANTIVNIALPSTITSQSAQLMVYDMQGRLISSYSLPNASEVYQLPIAQLVAGNYLLVMQSATIQYQTIIAIQH